MTDNELAMAYADGELDALAAKRFEKRMAENAGLADAVRAHRALRDRVARTFAPIADTPLPERLAELLPSNVVELRSGGWLSRHWRAAASMAACLAVGAALGLLGQAPSAGVSGDPLVASASLARTLDRQLAGVEGSMRVLVSFRDRQGSYCRVFETPAIGGIACRETGRWILRRMEANRTGKESEYRQAGSRSADLLAAAQEMMSGEALDVAAERAARDRAWRP